MLHSCFKCLAWIQDVEALIAGWLLLQVNATNRRGQTVLHVLASSLKDLCFEESLNPTEVLSKTFSILLSAGSDPNVLVGDP